MGATVTSVGSDRQPTSVVLQPTDLLIVGVLSVVALLVRWGGLPTDGVWFDDSWVTAGAIHGELGRLMVTGSSHPAFTVLLMGVDQLGGELQAFALPALLAGIAGPPVLFIALRKLGYEQSICALLAAALCVADVHILYSGRVKGYTLDTLFVIGLAVALPALARRQWGVRTAVGWVLVAIVLGLFSGYLLAASAAAGLVLVLHPTRDRATRVAAVTAQAVIQLAYVLWARTFSNLADIEEVMETSWDAHIELGLDPSENVSQILEHLRRVADIYPGGAGAWLTVFSIVAMAGLVIGATRGRRPTEALPARFFLVMVVGAFMGASLGLFPFGPKTGSAISQGGRHALWLVPGIAFGIAVVLQRLSLAVDGHRPDLRRVFDGTLLVLAVLVLVRGYGPPPHYPFPGSASATAFVDAQFGADDRLIVSGASSYAYMSSSDHGLRTVSTPNRQIGFVADYDDPHIGQMGVWADDEHDTALDDDLSVASPDEIEAFVGDSDRVFFLSNGAFGDQTQVVTQTLTPLGYRSTTHRFGVMLVQVWQRSAS